MQNKKEAPFTPGQRFEIRQIVREVLEEEKSRGGPIRGMEVTEAGSFYGSKASL